MGLKRVVGIGGLVTGGVVVGDGGGRTGRDGHIGQRGVARN